jgi:hypothetical protein
MNGSFLRLLTIGVMLSGCGNFAQGCDHYAITSAGADGQFNPAPLRDGELIRYPAYFDERH